MFPEEILRCWLQLSFLCMRRDVSQTQKRRNMDRPFSLHAQRCFQVLYGFLSRYIVFSACAEMFLTFLLIWSLITRFLCMRRDVSILTLQLLRHIRFSLHAQRCFLRRMPMCCCWCVFSACAEMFPPSFVPFLLSPRFLCMRRDVSKLYSMGRVTVKFSLHAQRCFH